VPVVAHAVSGFLRRRVPFRFPNEQHWNGRLLATLVCDTVLQTVRNSVACVPRTTNSVLFSAMYAIASTGDSPKGIDDGDTGLLVAVTATKRR